MAPSTLDPDILFTQLMLVERLRRDVEFLESIGMMNYWLLTILAGGTIKSAVYDIEGLRGAFAVTHNWSPSFGGRTKLTPSSALFSSLL